MKSDPLNRVIVPLIVLVAVSMAIVFLLSRVSGGKEIADDVATLSRLVRSPFALWGDYREAGFSDTWGSFPPLLPMLFSVLVAPWIVVAGTFWGFRVGVLVWTIVALFALDALLGREQGIPESRRRGLLFLFVLLPSVLGTIALIPEEEIYVSLFAAALYAAAAAKRWRPVPFLLLATALAGKYFLLVLAVPLAVYSPAPRRNLIAWCALCGGALAAYVLYHRFAHGLLPILSHDVDPGSSLSIWALLWNLGVQPPLRLVRILSLLGVAVFAAGFSLRFKKEGRPLVFAFAGTIIGTLALLSLSYPGYILWAACLLPVAIGLMKEKVHVFWAVALLFLWGVGEWGANLFRGVALALGADRPAGKEVIASFAQRLFGSDFPFALAHIVLLCLVLVAAAGLLHLLARAPTQSPVVRERTARTAPG